MTTMQDAVIPMPDSMVKRELRLPSKSVDEIIGEAGETVPWIVEDILARGALTDFSGLAKKGGKTTFWTHAIAAGARGEDIADFTTTPARYLYLTEQGTNFALSLRDSGLVNHPEHIRVVQFKDVSSMKWNLLIENAAADCQALGFDALVVDTFAVFARLKGSEENDSGPVSDRMRVLRMAAQKNDIGTVLIRHAGKDGTPRGSSAFEAEADILVNIARPQGNHGPNIRKLSGIGRYGEWERNIELQDGKYISHGTDNKVAFKKACAFIKRVLPMSPDDAIKKGEIMDLRKGPDESIKGTTTNEALAWLAERREIGMIQRMHERGKPKVYWNPIGG